MAPASSSFDDGVDYYEFLSITHDATDAEIQRAYRKTNLKYHPDKFKPTPEISVEQAAEKLDLLQKILGILKDPAEKAKYDQGRAAKELSKANKQRLDKDRKEMVESLEKKEEGSNGVKRTRDETLTAVQRIAKSIREDRETRQQKKGERRAEDTAAEEAQLKAETPAEPDPMQRTATVKWVKTGDGLDIDQTTLREMGEEFGLVESIMILKDKRRRLNGEKDKSVVGSGAITFFTLAAATKAVGQGPWPGFESVSWPIGKKGEGD